MTNEDAKRLADLRPDISPRIMENAPRFLLRLLDETMAERDALARKLDALETAARAAVQYHCKGYVFSDLTLWDEQTQRQLLDELGERLEQLDEQFP